MAINSNEPKNIKSDKHWDELIEERDKLVRALGVARNALRYYGKMLFNRITMEWMPGGPDKANSALNQIEDILE